MCFEGHQNVEAVSWKNIFQITETNPINNKISNIYSKPASNSDYIIFSSIPEFVRFDYKMVS